MFGFWYVYLYFIVWGLVGAYAVSNVRDRGGNDEEQMFTFTYIFLLGVPGAIIWLMIRPKEYTNTKPKFNYNTIGAVLLGAAIAFLVWLAFL